MNQRLKQIVKTTQYYFDLWKKAVFNSERSPDFAERDRSVNPPAYQENSQESGAPMMQKRSNYKATWNQLSGSMDSAKTYVAGYTHEEELEKAAANTFKVINNAIGIQPTDIVLEIGCGVGRNGRMMSSHCAKWIGTDISGNMLSYAAQRLQDCPNIELIELSSVSLKEIPDNSVDVVYCTVVFMHLYEWDRYKYVREAFRVLKPGGRCFFDNIDISSTHGWEIFMQGVDCEIEERPAYIGMISTGKELYTYATKAGFQDVKLQSWDDAWIGVTGVK